jgi:O-antigen/teichoic acid export membrane protein
VLSNWGVFVFSTIANFFVAPFVVHSLGNAAYGAWVLLGSLVGYLGLLDLGVRGAITRFVSRLHATADHEGAARFASAGLFLFSVSATIAILAGLGLAAVLDRLFEIPPALLPQARIAVILIACTIALALLGGLYGGVVTAMQRFELNGATEIAVEAVRITAVVLALRSGEGLVALAAIHLGCGILRFVIFFVLSRRVYPKLRIVRGRWKRSELRQVFGFSLASTALQGAGTVIMQLDAIVIGAFLPVAMVTYFAIAGTLSRYGKAVVNGISYTVPPRVSAQQGRGDMEGARRTGLLGGRVASLVHLPIVATFLVRGGTFIGLWMGAEYVDLSGRVLVILSLAYWFMAGRQIMVTTLMGLNRHGSLIPVMWAEAVLNVGLSVALVRPLGVIGVALGTTVPSLLLTPTAYPLLFSRVLAIPPARVWRDLWLRPTLAVLPFLLASLAFERLTTPTSLVGFFAQILAVLPVAAAGAWWVGLRREERVTAGQFAPPWLRRIAAPKGAWRVAADE